MKPAFGYYGGKQRLAKQIVERIPKHMIYIEPFAGSGAVLFAKPLPDVGGYQEVLNDIDGDLYNFYSCLRDRGDELIAKLELTPYSEDDHRISKDRSNCDDIERARRYFVSIACSFGNVVGAGWGRARANRNLANKFLKKIERLHEIVERIRTVSISNCDFKKIFEYWNSPHTFLYCDPPYLNTDQGHYKGFTEKDLQDLICLLDQFEGSFMLSGYESPQIKFPNDWIKEEFDHSLNLCHGIDGVDLKRKEIIYRRANKKECSADIKKIYFSGKLDCFKG